MQLSIIIPSYNRPEPTQRLVAAFEAQIRRLRAPVEIIVVDDASAPALTLPPGTTARLIRLERNGGAPRARQAGLRAATGAFIHFHDSDDGAPRDWLQGVLSALATAPGAAPDLLITARRVCSGGHGRWVTPQFVRRHADDPARIRAYLQFENCIGPLGGVTFSRRATARMSFPDLPSCQDWHMYYEAIGEPDQGARIAMAAHLAFDFRVDGADRISKDPARKRAGKAAAVPLMNRGRLRRRLIQALPPAGAASGGLRGLSARLMRHALLFFARRPATARALLGP